MTKNKWEVFSGVRLIKKDWLDYPCVYAFYFNEKLVYIGQTNNFTKRYHVHHFYKEGSFWITKWGNFVDFYIKIKYPIKFGEESMIEKRLIERLKPKYNKRVFPRIKHKTICQ